MFVSYWIERCSTIAEKVEKQSFFKHWTKCLSIFSWSKETSDGSFPAASSYALAIRMFWSKNIPWNENVKDDVFSQFCCGVQIRHKTYSHPACPLWLFLAISVVLSLLVHRCYSCRKTKYFLDMNNSNGKASLKRQKSPETRTDKQDVSKFYRFNV